MTKDGIKFPKIETCETDENLERDAAARTAIATKTAIGVTAAD
jgi:hypothetical protein